MLASARFYRAVVKVVLLAALSLGSMAGTAWAGGWVPTGDLPFTATDIAFDGEGNATVVGYGEGEEGGYVIQAITREPGGTWQPPVNLMMHIDPAPTDPQVAVNSQGEAVVVWGTNVPSSVGAAWAISRDVNGQWQEDPDLLSSSSVWFSDMDAVIDEDGTATAVWNEYDEVSNGFVNKSRVRQSGSDWDGAVDISNPYDQSIANLDLAINPAGDVAVAWMGDHDLEPGRVVRVKTRTAGSGWSAGDKISGDPDILDGEVRIALDDDGGMVVVWGRMDGGNPKVLSASKPANGAWSAQPAELGLGQNYSVVVDSEGTATAIWRTNTGNGSQIRTSSKPLDGGWSEPTNRAAALNAEDEKLLLPWIGVDHEDTVTALWARTDMGGGNAFAESARMPKGGSWGQAGDMSVDPAPNDAPGVAIDPQGNVVAVWSVPGLPLSSSSAALDWVAPELRDLQVPAEGILNQPVALSVDPFDAWSPVETEWTFADDLSIGGTQISHAFATLGSQSVTVTATDEAGNEAELSRSIEIKAAPPATNPDGPGGKGPSVKPNTQCKKAQARTKALKKKVRKSKARVKKLNRRIVKAKSTSRKRKLRAQRTKARKTLKKQKKALAQSGANAKGVCHVGK